MPFYYELKRRPAEERERTVDTLLRLRGQIRRELPAKTVRDTLNLATWNIRDFDSNKFGHGPRLGESFYYLAEVISAFDLVAVQEVNQIGPLKRLMKILGPNWDYIATDITEGRSGNNERMTFVFDRRKILFRNIAGEIVLPGSARIEGDRQFARTPFMVSFQSGWFKFNLCTVHLYYGSDRGAAYERRVEEIDAIARFLARRAKKEDSNMIVLGDFNIVSREDDTFKALARHGWVVPDELNVTTNQVMTKYYDQIAFITRRNELMLGDSEPNAGAFNPFTSVYRPRDWKTYYDLVRDTSKWDTDRRGPTDDEGKKRYFQGQWRTWQLSDHLPLWVQLKIDFTEPYLRGLANPAG